MDCSQNYVLVNPIKWAAKLAGNQNFIWRRASHYDQTLPYGTEMGQQMKH